MTIQSIIDGILAYHPDIGDRRTCDVIVGADPNRECTGILVSIAPTVPIIRKAIEIEANFIFVHEPTFFSGYDDECEWLAGNDVYEEKLALLVDNGITVYRDHDHIHMHRPDGIFYYMMKQLGWLEYEIPCEGMGHEVKLPPTRLGDLVAHVKEMWNFTFNRKFTFKSAANVPIAMLKVLLFYVVFTPLSIWWGVVLTNRWGWNEYLVLGLTMVVNFVTEFLYQRFFVFGKSIDTAEKPEKGEP